MSVLILGPFDSDVPGPTHCPQLSLSSSNFPGVSLEGCRTTSSASAREYHPVFREESSRHWQCRRFVVVEGGSSPLPSLNTVTFLVFPSFHATTLIPPSTPRDDSLNRCNSSGIQMMTFDLGKSDVDPS